MKTGLYSATTSFSPSTLPCAPCPLQRVQSEPQQLAQGDIFLIRQLVESLDGFGCRLGVELLIAAGPVDARFAAMRARSLCLPAREIVLFGDALDCFLCDGLIRF